MKPIRMGAVKDEREREKEKEKEKKEEAVLGLGGFPQRHENLHEDVAKRSLRWEAQRSCKFACEINLGERDRRLFLAHIS